MSTSPGTYLTEYDLSQRVLSTMSTSAVFVGEARRGPVGERTLCTTDKAFIQTFGKPDPKIGFEAHATLAYLQEGTNAYYTRVAPEAKYGGLTVSFDGRFNKITAWDAGTEYPDEYPFEDASDLFIVYGANQGAWNYELSIMLVPETRDLSSNMFRLDIYEAGITIPVESHEVCLDYQVDGFGIQRNIAEYINQRSNRIRIKLNESSEWLLLNESFRYINTLIVGDEDGIPGVMLAGGHDGRRPTISEMMELGWDLYRDVEDIEVDLLVHGGRPDADLMRYLDQISRERMDCMAILDVPTEHQRVDRALTFRRKDLMIDSSYSALYTPDVLVRDQYNDLRLMIPPSGCVAAAYAATDRDYAVWFAPAGMTRGHLDVRGVAQTYNRPDRDMLYQSQINAIRVFQGEGVKVWGADTLQVMASALSNVSVRRLMLFIERALARAVNYSVFDPNDEILWAKLDDLCTTFLRPIKNERGLYDFKVVCDDTNNIPETIASGDVMLDVYLDPVLPAKRIHLTAVINKTGVRVTGTARQ